MVQKQLVLLIIGGFAKEFMLWATGALATVFPGARLLVAPTVDEAISSGRHVEVDLVFLEPTVDELQDFCHEFWHLGNDPRQIVFCGERIEGDQHPDPLVAAMNAALLYDAVYMPYGKLEEPVGAFQFIRAQLGDLLRAPPVTEPVSAR